MKQPKIGDPFHIGTTVHYRSYGTPQGEFPSVCRAALITAIQQDGTLDLAVLNPTGMFFNQGVTYSLVHKGGTWHWPEHP